MRNRAVRMPHGAEAALAIGLSVVLVVSEVVLAQGLGLRMAASGLVTQLAGAGAIAMLRAAPVAAAVVIGAATPMYYILGTIDSWGGWLPFVVGVFLLSAERHRISALTATTVALALFALGEGVSFVPARALTVAAWLLVVWAAGEIARGRRDHLDQVELRALEAERTREQQARRRAIAEQLRTAREVQEMLVDRILLIDMRAATALDRRDPDDAFDALDAIEGASTSSLRELRAGPGAPGRAGGDDGSAGPDRAPGTRPERRPRGRPVDGDRG
ncbi:hypothetical protein ACFOVU_17145 [Nocardiopsis sediminis]|uniref:Histidine kinase n=1 Tax=Nocardiopsis sediminis TaxID=1778267 RepID=A0ABV8FRI2_9ACTN